MRDVVQIDLTLRHLLAIGKTSESFGTTFNIAVEKLDECSSFVFLVSKASGFSLCLALKCPTEFLELQDPEDTPDKYIARLDKFQQHSIIRRLPYQF
jgi:hypothetical protein